MDSAGAGIFARLNSAVSAVQRLATEGVTVCPPRTEAVALLHSVRDVLESGLLSREGGGLGSVWLVLCSIVNGDSALGVGRFARRVISSASGPSGSGSSVLDGSSDAAALHAAFEHAQSLPVCGPTDTNPDCRLRAFLEFSLNRGSLGASADFLVRQLGGSRRWYADSALLRNKAMGPFVISVLGKLGAVSFAFDAKLRPFEDRESKAGAHAEGSSSNEEKNAPSAAFASASPSSTAEPVTLVAARRASAPRLAQLSPGSVDGSSSEKPGSVPRKSRLRLRSRAAAKGRQSATSAAAVEQEAHVVDSGSADASQREHAHGEGDVPPADEQSRALAADTATQSVYTSPYRLGNGLVEHQDHGDTATTCVQGSIAVKKEQSDAEARLAASELVRGAISVAASACSESDGLSQEQPAPVVHSQDGAAAVIDSSEAHDIAYSLVLECIETAMQRVTMSELCAEDESACSAESHGERGGDSLEETLQLDESSMVGPVWEFETATKGDDDHEAENGVPEQASFPSNTRGGGMRDSTGVSSRNEQHRTDTPPRNIGASDTDTAEADQENGASEGEKADESFPHPQLARFNRRTYVIFPEKGEPKAESSSPQRAPRSAWDDGVFSERATASTSNDTSSAAPAAAGDTAASPSQTASVSNTAETTTNRASTLILRVQPRRTLDDQDFACAGCGAPFDLGSEDSFQWCEYSGQYFCQSCHTGETAFIPARMVNEWDFTRYAVSSEAKTFLRSIRDSPVLFIHPDLIKSITTLGHVWLLRKQLTHIRDFVLTCPKREELLRIIAGREHLMMKTNGFSIRDVVEVKNGRLVDYLMRAVSKFIVHITQDCNICKLRGSFCEVCQAEEIIYPFQITKVAQCKECAATFHRPCWESISECPKCARIRRLRRRR